MSNLIMPVAELRGHTEAACRALGLPAEDAAIAADHLIEADLWGRSGHGVSARFRFLEKTLLNPRRTKTWRIHRDAGACVTVDGALYPGYVVAARCADIAAERAKQFGVATVAAFGMTHTGMVGYHAARIAREGCVAIIFANCCPLVVPTGAARKLLGTNPMTFAFPGPRHPIVADLSTSTISYGTFMLARQAGKALPLGALVDCRGLPTDAPEVCEGLSPLGGAKGTALSFAVQAISALLAGATPVPEPGLDYGLTIVAIDPERFAGQDAFVAGMARLLESLHGLPAAEGSDGARAPGERAFAEKERRLREGIAVDEGVWRRICELAEAAPGPEQPQ